MSNREDLAPGGAPSRSQEMKHDPEKHYRRSIRLKDYDYSQGGAYFVTICTHERECLFGATHDGESQLSDFGTIVQTQWLDSARMRREIHLDTFVVMPNHLHGIVFIRKDISASVGATGGRPNLPKQDQKGDRQSPLRARGPGSRSLAAFVGGFKSACTRLINEFRCTPGLPVWQRNYYDHVIRNEKALEAIGNYIAANPEQWANDPENPVFAGKQGSSTL